jgi:hypothetical protein
MLYVLCRSQLEFDDTKFRVGEMPKERVCSVDDPSPHNSGWSFPQVQFGNENDKLGGNSRNCFPSLKQTCISTLLFSCSALLDGNEALGKDGRAGKEANAHDENRVQTQHVEKVKVLKSTAAKSAAALVVNACLSVQDCWSVKVCLLSQGLLVSSRLPASHGRFTYSATVVCQATLACYLDNRFSHPIKTIGSVADR